MYHILEFFASNPNSILHFEVFHYVFKGNWKTQGFLQLAKKQLVNGMYFTGTESHHRKKFKMRTLILMKRLNEGKEIVIAHCFTR